MKVRGLYGRAEKLVPTSQVSKGENTLLFVLHEPSFKENVTRQSEPQLFLSPCCVKTHFLSLLSILNIFLFVCKASLQMRESDERELILDQNHIILVVKIIKNRMEE